MFKIDLKQDFKNTNIDLNSRQMFNLTSKKMFKIDLNSHKFEIDMKINMFEVEMNSYNMFKICRIKLTDIK